MSQIKLSIKFFGALRQYMENGELHLALPEKMNLSQLRELIIMTLRQQYQHFNDDHLLDHAVFANEVCILQENNFIIETDTTIAVLPPVCGG